MRLCVSTCRYVDRGGGKRKGAFAIYLEPWHADIFDWLDLRKKHGKEEVPSLFGPEDFAGEHCRFTADFPENMIPAQMAVLVMQARARDLFYGLWTTDLFMEHVEANADWSLFCPNEAPGLADCWGEEHSALYTRYEREGRAKRVIKAQQLWFAILEAQVLCHWVFLYISKAVDVSPWLFTVSSQELLLHCTLQWSCTGGDRKSIYAVQGFVQP